MYTSSQIEAVTVLTRRKRLHSIHRTWSSVDGPVLMVWRRRNILLLQGIEPLLMCRAMRCDLHSSHSTVTILSLQRSAVLVIGRLLLLTSAAYLLPLPLSFLVLRWYRFWYWYWCWYLPGKRKNIVSYNALRETRLYTSLHTSITVLKRKFSEVEVILRQTVSLGV
jgi:hypothetical protein